MLLVLASGYGLFFNAVQQPYRAQERNRQIIGNKIRDALKNEPPSVLYKYGIVGMYSELYYSGRKVIQVESLAEIPQNEEVVYLIAPEFPQIPNREWSNLMTPEKFGKQSRLMLWKGISRQTL